MKKAISFSLASILLLLSFAGCAAGKQPAEPRFAAFADLPGADYLEYLAVKREDVEKALDMTDETWDYLKMTDGSNNPRPNLKEPVTLNGDDYTLYFRFTEGPERDSQSYLIRYYYLNTVESNDAEEKLAKITDLYDLLVSELGEPEEPAIHPSSTPENSPPMYTTVREGVAQSFSTQPYMEKWVLSENVAYPDTAEDVNVVLLATMTVRFSPSVLELQLEYELRDSNWTEVARYPQKVLGRDT